MQGLQEEILQIGSRIGILENALVIGSIKKAEVEQHLFQLLGFELIAHVIIFPLEIGILCV